MPSTPRLRPVSDKEGISDYLDRDQVDDGALIAASVGRPEQFAVLFDRHASELRRYCARRVGPQVAEDVVAEVFLIAFERRVGFDPARVALPWLYGIATNLLHRHQRQEVRAYRVLAKTGIDPVMESPADRVAERVDAGAFGSELAAALAKMSSRDRDVLLLFAWAGLGYAEIAETLQIPVGTVRSRLNRARTRLRAALPPEARTSQTIMNEDTP